MSAAEPLLVKGDRVRVRPDGHGWSNGVVVLASENGLSVAIAFEHFPILPIAVAIHEEGAMMLLSFISGKWFDVVSSAKCEVEKAA